MTDTKIPPLPNGAATKAFLDGAMMNARAADERERCGRPEVADQLQQQASELASTLLAPLAEHDTGIGVGNELAIVSPMTTETEEDARRLYLRDTVKNPSLVHAKATSDRLALLDNIDALHLGLDLADTIQPRNSIERTLAHAIAACFANGMRLLERSARFQDRADGHDQNASDPQRKTLKPNVAAVEAARLSNAAMLSLRTANEVIGTFQRLRTAGRGQRINVTYTDNRRQVAVNAKTIKAGEKGSRAGAKGKRGGKPK